MFVSMFTYVRFSDPLSTNVNVLSEFRVVGLVSSAYVCLWIYYEIASEVILVLYDMVLAY